MINTTERRAAEKAEREAEAKAKRRAEQAQVVEGLRRVLEGDEQLLAFARGRIAGGVRGKLNIGPEAFFAPYINIGLTERRFLLQHIHPEDGRPSEILPHDFPVAEVTDLHFSDIETFNEEKACRLTLRLSNEQHFRLRLRGAENCENAQAMVEVFRSLTLKRRQSATTATQDACPACGRALDGPFKFCPYCGISLRPAATATAPAEDRIPDAPAPPDVVAPEPPAPPQEPEFGLPPTPSEPSFGVLPTPSETAPLPIPEPEFDSPPVTLEPDAAPPAVAVTEETVVEAMTPPFVSETVAPDLPPVSETTPIDAAPDWRAAFAADLQTPPVNAATPPAAETGDAVEETPAANDTLEEAEFVYRYTAEPAPAAPAPPEEPDAAAPEPTPDKNAPKEGHEYRWKL